MADDRRERWHSGLHPDTFAHLDSPAGVSGTGSARRPGLITDAWPSSRIPHPDSPAGRLFCWRIELPDLDIKERARAVYEALVSALKYLPATLWEATGQELHSILSGILPSLVLMIGVLALTTAVGAGGGALLGTIVGAIVASAPGAAILGETGFTVGAEAGLAAGVALLNYLGLAFLAIYIGKSLAKADEAAIKAALIAWTSVDHPQTQKARIQIAAHEFAVSVALIFRGFLQGVVAFLLAEGSAAAASRVPELVNRLRASKLGTGFAEWVERNWQGLVENPRLQGEQGSSVSGSGGSPGSAGEHPPKASPKTQEIPTTEGPSEPSATPKPGKPGSPQHKAQRWAEYQARTAPDKRWSYDRWTKSYDLNMRRAIEANKAVDSYHEQIGGWGEREVTVDVEGVPRRLDIADEAALKGVEYKTGEQYLTQDNTWEIARDEILVKEGGWRIDWVFEKPPSGPLQSALEAAGINVIVR